MELSSPISANAIKSSYPRKTSKKLLSSLPIGIFFYYMAFFLYAMMAAIENTQFATSFSSLVQHIGTGIDVFIVVLLASKILLERIRFDKWLFVLLAAAIGFISWIQSGYGLLFWLVLFVVCGNGVRIRTLAGISLFVIACFLVFMPLFALSGVIDNVIKIREDGTIRYAMGFNHPNTLGIYIVMCSTCIAVLRFNDSPLVSIVISFVAALLSIWIADSQTAALLALIQVCLLFIFRNVSKPSSRRMFVRLFCLLFCIIVLLSFYFMVRFDSTDEIHTFLDDFLNTRLYWAHRQYVLAPLTLFGNDYLDGTPLFWSNGNPVYYYVDNAYANLILRYGIVPAVFFLLGYVYLFRSLEKHQKWDVVLFGAFLMALYGVTERAFIDISCNYFVIYFASLLYGEGSTTSTKSKNENYSIKATSGLKANYEREHIHE